MLTRRQLLVRGAAGGLGLTLAGRLPMALAVPPVVTPYADPLKIPDLMTPAATSGGRATAFDIGLEQIEQVLHSDLATTPSTVWAYGEWNGVEGAGAAITGASWPARTMVVARGTPVDVAYYHDLPATHLFPETDALIIEHVQAANPGATTADVQAVRINTHLHGGHIAAAADGNPHLVKVVQDPDGPPTPVETRHGGTQRVRYANDQPAGLAWYHDHALGITRSNVMTGLAGGYLIVDPDDEASGLPPLSRDIPLIIQDRLIDPETGQLLYPGPGTPPGRSWIPEFFGDVVLVNGGIWPDLVVQPRRYRFRILNGSNARFYNLRLVASTSGLISVTQIGTDLGYLRYANRAGQYVGAPAKEILAAPAERCDIIVDFSGLAGQTVELRDNRLPPGTVSPAPPLPRRGIMRFTVTGAPVHDAVPTLPTPPDSANATRTIVHTLEEVMDPAADAPLMALLDGKLFHDPLSDEDRIENGTTAYWDIVNVTADSHPIHLHLVDFEVVHRQRLDVPGYLAELAGAREDGSTDPPTPWDPVARDTDDGWMMEPMPSPTRFLRGRAVPPPPTEQGPKDTVRANPGEVTRIKATFTVPEGTDLPAKYVWHCHILEHEENDMMRPYDVIEE